MEAAQRNTSESSSERSCNVEVKGTEMHRKQLKMSPFYDLPFQKGGSKVAYKILITISSISALPSLYI